MLKMGPNLGTWLCCDAFSFTYHAQEMLVFTILRSCNVFMVQIQNLSSDAHIFKQARGTLLKKDKFGLFET